MEPFSAIHQANSLATLSFVVLWSRNIPFTLYYSLAIRRMTQTTMGNEEMEK